jgi:hypothetical protein
MQAKELIFMDYTFKELDGIINLKVYNNLDLENYLFMLLIYILNRKLQLTFQQKTCMKLQFIRHYKGEVC